MPSQQQNIQKPERSRLVEVFLLKSEEKRAIGTLLQKGVCRSPVRLFQGSAADHWIEVVHTFITAGKKNAQGTGPVTRGK